MASFYGQYAGETITPNFVSPTVVRSPNSFPGPGDDYIDGGGGADRMWGGGGNDTYVIDNPGDFIDNPLDPAGPDFFDGHVDTVLSSISYVLPWHVENLVLTGTSNLNGTGNYAPNLIYGNEGNNALSGNQGDDTLYGRGGTTALLAGKT